jgi:tRNA U34 2-thiouridine synthase MnmA/TrmU
LNSVPKRHRAIALLSGGLDSTLAVKLMIDQGIEVIALNFMTPFCNCTAKSSSCKHEAVRVATEFGIPIRVISKGMEYLKLVENPLHGRGRALNPCLDCRIFMHKAARELMLQEDASFLITGEVLGQRPMSQQRQAMELIERESGTNDLLLRPLSAHHFEPTLAEREGWVDRNQLLALQGRTRSAQIQLAKDLGVSDYPCPAGGCLLTEPAFSGRLNDLFIHKPDYTIEDVRLLRTGRHFRLRPELKVIVGRNQEENEVLRHIPGTEHLLFHCEDFGGPTALIREVANANDELMIARMLLHYAGISCGTVTVAGRRIVATDPLSAAAIDLLRISPYKKEQPSRRGGNKPRKEEELVN